MILLPIAQAKSTAIKETIEDTVTVKPQYLGVLIVLISEIFLTKQWIGKLIVVMSIATIEKIPIQERIIMIYSTLRVTTVAL